MAIARYADHRGKRGGALAARKGAPALARKRRMLVVVALASKMARIIWALLTTGGAYRASMAA
jgi:hypothetical protein